MTAQSVITYFENQGIEVRGVLIGKDYYSGVPDRISGKKVFCLEQFLKTSDKEIDLVIGHTEVTKRFVNSICESKIHKMYLVDLSGSLALGPLEPNIYDTDFYDMNRGHLEGVRDDLVDEASKRALDEFIYQKRTSYLWKPYTTNTQYFDEDFIQLDDNEVFVDVGAYDGDTIEQFTSKCRAFGTSWERIMAFEPSNVNMEKAKQRLVHVGNIEYFTTLLWSESSFLGFQEYGKNGGMSRIDEEGSNRVYADKFDNIVGNQKVTFIKMDIEGSEYNALLGMENSIRTYHPKLAVCVYHRKEDLIRIPSLIKSFNPEYRLYFRNYHFTATESVLYAI